MTTRAHIKTVHSSEHHCETSLAPLLVVMGLFLVLPLGFSVYFVYENTLLFAICVGVGLPVMLWGIALWIHEGTTQKPLVAGLSNVALPIFIISECFIFLSLFAAYWTMRLSAGVWPPEGTPYIGKAIPVIMTILLISSSVTIHIGEEKLNQNDLKSFKKWLYLTIALGLVFLGCTIYEYWHLTHLDFIPSTNIFATAFYSITGFHAAHVAAGLCTFLALLIPLFKEGHTNKTFVTCASVYWHFVDVVWIFVVTQIYFW